MKSSSTIYPKMTDYLQALGQSCNCLQIPELKQGKTQPGIFNLPKSYNGAFAVVVPLEVKGVTWAIRMFTARVEDVETHYREIKVHLTDSKLPYFAEFEYHPQGILINGRTYPVISMEWLDGDSLKEFVEKSLNKPMTLRKLADSWRKLLLDLHVHKIAHGDLQEANIKVQKKENQLCLRLIDYDSMVIPSRVGLPENIEGVPAYQHPCRHTLTKKHLAVDTFSGLVIYISLLTLSYAPQLWEEWGIEDIEGILLLEAEDYIQCRSSEKLQRIASLGPEMKGLLEHLYRLCEQQDVLHIPSLEWALSEGKTNVVPNTLSSSVQPQLSKQIPSASDSNQPPKWVRQALPMVLPNVVQQQENSPTTLPPIPLQKEEPEIYVRKISRTPLRLPLFFQYIQFAMQKFVEKIEAIEYIRFGQNIWNVRSKIGSYSLDVRFIFVGIIFTLFTITISSIFHKSSFFSDHWILFLFSGGLGFFLPIIWEICEFSWNAEIRYRMLQGVTWGSVGGLVSGCLLGGVFGLFVLQSFWGMLGGLFFGGSLGLLLGSSIGALFGALQTVIHERIQNNNVRWDRGMSLVLFYNTVVIGSAGGHIGNMLFATLGMWIGIAVGFFIGILFSTIFLSIYFDVLYSSETERIR